MIIMKKNKEQFLLIILSILMVIILSTNLYSFIIEESTLTSNIISIISLLMLITCIIIILSYKNNNLKEQRDSKEIDKNNYFMNLAHELRTPLNIILSTEQLITNLNSRNENIDKDKLNNYMDILRGNSKRLLKLINDIIDLSKIQEEMYNIDIMEHEIVFFVEDLALSMKEYIEAKGIELIIDPEIEEKIIECDINDIEKCLINLIGNAMKFTSEGGKIIIRISDLNDKVKISIIDSGIGISEKDINEIFNRFEQAYNKKSEEFGGSGIGLMLTKQIIELHKGDLVVKSELGKGSEFSILLPVKQLK